MARLDINVRGVEGESGVAIAEMVGAIDGTTVDSFQDYLEEILKKGVKKLILDMAGVPYVNSTGLGSLVKYKDRFQGTGGGMARNEHRVLTSIYPTTPLSQTISTLTHPVFHWPRCY